MKNRRITDILLVFKTHLQLSVISNIFRVVLRTPVKRGGKRKREGKRGEKGMKGREQERKG
jgi:hypothetical protein